MSTFDGADAFNTLLQEYTTLVIDRYKIQRSYDAEIDTWSQALSQRDLVIASLKKELALITPATKEEQSKCGVWDGQ